MDFSGKPSTFVRICYKQYEVCTINKPYVCDAEYVYPELEYVTWFKELSENCNINSKE